MSFGDGPDGLLTNKDVSEKSHNQPRMFYGWYIIAALFFATFLSIGARQGFGVFVKTWEEDWAVSTAAISFAAAIGTLVNGFSQPVFGWLTDKFGGRPVLLASFFVTGLATAGVATISSVLGLMVLYGFIISFSSGGIGFQTTGVIVARWFEKKRGVAMAVLVSGGSVGGLVFVPFLSYLLIEVGWQVAWIITGLIALLIGIPLLLIVVKSKPDDIGLTIDGVDPNSEEGLHGSADAVGPKFVDKWFDALSSRPIWQLSFGYFVCGITTTSIGVHFVRWANSEDITTGTAALAFGLLSGINAAGVLVVGLLSDRFQRKNLLGGVYLVRGLAFLTLIFLPGDIALWAFALIGGMSWLATVPLTASLTADVYGVRNLGMLFGLANMSHAFGGALAVFLFGWAFTNWGSYNVPFVVGAITLLAAGVVCLSISEKTNSVRFNRISQSNELDSGSVTAGAS